MQTILLARCGLTDFIAPNTTNSQINTLLEQSGKKAKDPTAYSIFPALSFFLYDQCLPGVDASSQSPSQSQPQLITHQPAFSHQ